MKLEDMSNIDDARQALVEKVVKIAYALITHDNEELDRQLIFYKNLKDYLKIENYGINLKPYDNVIKELRLTNKIDKDLFN
jgi:hypothetical protein